MTLKTHARALGLLAAAFALGVPGAQAQTPANAPAPVSRANWPADVDRQSGFRARRDIDVQFQRLAQLQAEVDLLKRRT